MLTKQDGQINSSDLMQQRIGNGTIGSKMLVPGGTNSTSLTSIVDNADPRILYGAISDIGPGPVTLQSTREQSFDYNGSTTWIQTFGGGAQFHFNGTSIGIMGRMNLNSSAIKVYIDGKEAPGRVLAFATLDAVTYAASGLNATDTSIVVTSGDVARLSGNPWNTVMIGKELIQYTSISGNTLTGCTRGYQNTTAKAHDWTEMVYRWDSIATLNFGVGAPDFANNQLVWYNPFLESAEHTITFGVVHDAGSPSDYFWFDGFLVGAILGANQVYRSIGTATIGPITTDVNGFASLGQLFTRTGPAIIGLLGWHQILPATGYPSTEPMAHLGCQADANSGAPSYYLQNARASTNYYILLVFSYIGESL